MAKTLNFDGLALKTHVHISTDKYEMWHEKPFQTTE